jgi:beta-galactosidase
MFFGVAYYPEHWSEDDWRRDAANIRECGMDGVRIGEFGWSRMEPEEGVFSFDWLDRAIDTLGEAGLQVILGTPTATPPSWLVHKHPEILPVDANGVQMKNGVRKYYCHSNMTYRDYCRRITSELAQRYGDNPHVVGWQVDNEFGDHDTTRCYCQRCRHAFIDWCEEKYGSVTELNSAWGTVFWSQEYSAWAEIDLPYPRREIGLNPSHLLDYYRFASDQVVSFCENQVSALRDKISEQQWLTTNVIATYWEIDLHELSKHLDFISWDCYSVIDATSPVRHPGVGPSPPINWPARPEMYSLVHDMMRSVTKQPFWVMETAGEDRLVSYHTLAHGGGGVNFFRWRGSRFGAEQYRGGFEYHGVLGDRFHEDQELSSELERIRVPLVTTEFSAQVGLLYSFDMGWAYDINFIYPRSTWIDGVGYWRLLEEYYRAFWRENISIQPLGANDDLTRYPVLVVPCLYLTSAAINAKLSEYVEQGGTLIVGPASGTKDWNNVYLDALPPDGELKNVFGCELIGSGHVGSFEDVLKVTMTPDAPFACDREFSIKSESTGVFGAFDPRRPAEALRPTTARVFGHFSTGQPACTINRYGSGIAVYLGFSPDENFMRELIGWLEVEQKVSPVMKTPDGVEVTVRKGEHTEVVFVVNHNSSPTTVRLDTTYKDLVRDCVLPDLVEIAPHHTLVLAEVRSAGR